MILESLGSLFRVASETSESTLAVKWLTRKGLDWTGKFPTVAEAIAKLPAETALIDGELASEDAKGISRFSLLQQDLKAGRHDRMVFYVFDLMHLDGTDLRPLPLNERKAALGKLVARARGAVRLSESLTERGPVLLKKACKMGLEGIVSKLADAPYRSGRGHAWVKSKCSDRQEFVVAGFAPSTADAQAVGALVLAVYDRGKLKYAGRTGTGFTHDTAHQLFRALKACERKTINPSSIATAKPTLISGKILISSPETIELRTGYSLSVRATALMRKSLIEIRMPSLSSNSVRISSLRPRSFSISTSLKK